MTSSVFDSSCQRSVRLSKRPDLQISKQVYRDEPYWLIKDPLEMEFYRLNEEEYAVLLLVDGNRSLDDIKEEFERQFTPQRITLRELQTFISDLQKKSLLAYADSDVAPRLVEREREKQQEKLKKKLAGLLALKWRGVDPDRFLDAILPYVGWFFSLPAVLCGFVFMTSALLWLLVHWQDFMAKLPELATLFSQGNLLLLVAVIMGMKVVHEMGHAIVFKRFGGECHEIGVMLLMMVIPTLYCGTSDSWMLKSKWQRAAIGAAGMYVEVMLAAAATFVWWFSEPGMLNLICLNTMASGTVSVMLMNGNPFFKLDGYYIASDILELPNLQECAGKLTQTMFLKYGLGIDEDAEPHSRWSTKFTLVAYCLTTFIVKVLFLVIINFTLIEKLNACGLGYAAFAVGLVSLVMLMGPSMFGMYEFFKVPGRFHRIEPMKLSILLAIIAGTLGLVFVIPFPYSVNCPFTIQPLDAHKIYVEHDAILREAFVDPGDRVTEGQRLVQLENLEDSLELSRLQAEAREHDAELQLLEQTRSRSPAETARISELRQSLATAREKMAEYEEIVRSFDVRATRDGFVIPKWKEKSPTDPLQLDSFDGSTLGDENQGTWFKSGQELCMIGDLNVWEAVLAVNEHDVGLVQAGQSARLMLDALPGTRLAETIETVAKKQTENLPGSLSRPNGGSIQLQQSAGGESGDPRPNDEHFEARVSLPKLDVELSSGLRGQARIRVGSRTLWQRVKILLYRSLRKRLQ